jgi:hypothetical protein
MGLMSRIREAEPVGAGDRPTSTNLPAEPLPPLEISAAEARAHAAAMAPNVPAIPCLICESPLFWFSTYDLDPAVPASARQLRCCECDPPPGRSFIGSKWLIVTKMDGSPAWDRFTRGGGDESPDLDDPPPAGGPIAPRNWDDWVELDLPDGSKTLAPPGWRRLNLLRVEILFGINRAWQILQKRTDAFFTKLAPKS